MRPKAYSFIRFSTPEQKLGTSEKRQIQRAREYCQRRKLNFDESLVFKTEGVSAFRGKHKKVGSLALFLQMVREGEIEPGNYLLIEDVDRLSRENYLDAQQLVTELVKAGITIVTVSDETEYSEESLRDIGLIYKLVGKIHQAHEESRKKSERIRLAWDIKRKEGGILTGRCPEWLRLSKDRKSFEKIADRVKVVRQIFQWTANGVGKFTICRRLNHEQNTPTWGRGKRKGKLWHYSYVHKILYNRSVLGEFQNHELITAKDGSKVRNPIGEPILDYFPRIISPALWEEAHEGMETRRNNPGGRKGKEISNLFTKVAVCGYCGSAMYFLNKGEWQYLRCSRSHSGGGCFSFSWPYGDFERLFFRFITEVDFSKLTHPNTDTRIKRLQDQKREVSHKVKEHKEAIERLFQLIKKGTAVDLVNDEIEGENRALKELQEQEAKLRDTISREVKAQQALSLNAQEVLRQIVNERNPDARILAQAEIRKAITQIKVCPVGLMTADMAKDARYPLKKHLAEAEALKRVKKPGRFFEVLFANGAVRIVVDWLDRYEVGNLVEGQEVTDENLDGITKEDVLSKKEVAALVGEKFTFGIPEGYFFDVEYAWEV